MKCPVCHRDPGGYYELPVDYSSEELKAAQWTGKLRMLFHDYPMYQRSYPGAPDYISPRCERCYAKAEKKRENTKST